VHLLVPGIVFTGRLCKWCRSNRTSCWERTVQKWLEEDT